MTRILIAAAVLTLGTGPAFAQIPVTDPGNLVQAVLIAERTLREYEALWAQFQTLRRMSQGLGGMARYRIPAVPGAVHDANRWAYGRSWLEGLNAGDRAGAGYGAVVRRLERPAARLDGLPPEARRAVENAYATVDITDAVARLAGDQVGRSRTYAHVLQRAIDALEDDVVSAAPGQHEMTAILDKVAAGALIGRRQDAATNQLLSSALEQLLARNKRLRDTETGAMNMRLGGLHDGRTAAASVVRGAADDLRIWRQP
jgi:conjugal transfer/entry exclusion protein